MYEIINNKKRGLALTDEEIRYVVDGFRREKISDCQMSALLMAIYFNGMTPEETASLTMAMAKSGRVIDLSFLRKKIVDKHSTGGVGDKTTLIVAPIAAAAGISIAKMSGRGLGHTGGTIDKLESIPGFSSKITERRFYNTVKKHGLCIVSQSNSLAPADGKIYALRDMTATVDSIPLIAASIMSKKIAAGADYIFLDVKVGNGAFMKDLKSAEELARTMVDIGNNCGKKTKAIITDMSSPLGTAIGNSLEVIECIEVLNGRGDTRLITLSKAIATEMLHLADFGSLEECGLKVNEVIANGQALNKLADMVKAQYGDNSYIFDPSKFRRASTKCYVKASKSGYISYIDTEGVGISAMILGAGRTSAEDEINYSAGIRLNRNLGSYVNKGDTIAELYSDCKKMGNRAKKKFVDSFTISDDRPVVPDLVYKIVE